MSMEGEQGKPGRNITTAVKVLRETYTSLNLLLNEMDILAKEDGFLPLTSKFLRWRSDADEEAWLISSFIKLYQLESDPEPDPGMLAELRNGPVYAVEIQLDSGEGYPEITISRFSFDLSRWIKIPSVSEHWLFYHPYRRDDKFNIQEDGGIWSSKPRKQASQTYWGMKSVVGRSFPLLNVTDAESIKLEIFQGLLSLPQE